MGCGSFSRVRHALIVLRSSLLGSHLDDWKHLKVNEVSIILINASEDIVLSRCLVCSIPSSGFPRFSTLM